MARGKARPRSLSSGGSVWEVLRQASCDAPIALWYVAAVETTDGYQGGKLAAQVLRRCRKCEGCLRMKSADWARRAREEYGEASRTWMGTLTVAPEESALFDARIAAAGLWPERSRLSDAAFSKALFRLRARYLGQHVSGWLDLVRSWATLRGSPAGELRYLLVAEAHRSGLPHMHILVHEAQGGFIVRGSVNSRVDNGEVVYRKYKLANGEWKLGTFVSDEAMLRKTWELGHSKFQLCFDAKEAYYLCKYMSKDMGGPRVRASVHYGERSERNQNREDLEPTEEEGVKFDPPSKQENL